MQKLKGLATNLVFILLSMLSTSLRVNCREFARNPIHLEGNIRNAVDAAYAARFSEVECTVDLPLKDGGDYTWTFVDPGLLLAKMVSECSALGAVYSAALAENPPRQDAPWHLIIAWDEFAPGDKLRVDNRRKAQVLSFSFRELGQAALMHEWAWCIPIVVRSTVLARVRGGWSSMLRHYLQRQLFGACGLASAGVPLVLGGRSHLLFAEVSNFLSDGDGFMKALCCKGASGLKPCFIHDNVFKKDSDLAHRREGFCEIDCDDPAVFVKRTNAALTEAWDLLAVAHGRVQAGTMSKAAFERIEKLHGLTYVPEGLLSDVALRERVRLIDVHTTDWVHNALQDGVFTTEAWLFIKASGIPAGQISAFLADDAWEFPVASAAKSKGLFRVFDSYRSASCEENDKLKCSASELLGLYGLLRFFFAVHTPHVAALDPKRLSFEAACRVLDVLLVAKRGVASARHASDHLMAACREHLRLHKAAYGTGCLKPKHHWLLDVPPQLERDDLVIDAFVVERNHLIVKAVAENIKHLATFERSVLSGILNVQFRRASNMTQGSVAGSPLVALYGNAQRYGSIEMASHTTYLGFQAKRVETYGQTTPSNITHTNINADAQPSYMHACWNCMYACMLETACMHVVACTYVLLFVICVARRVCFHSLR